MDTLKEHPLNAIFFVVGQNLESKIGKEIMKRAYEGGHTIGNHTYTNPSLTKLSDEQIRDELPKTEELIGDYIGNPKLFRPPYGATNSRVDRVIQDLGYLKVMWNVDTLDWKKRSIAWVNHAMSQIKVREDSLVLMHDIHKSTATGVS